MNATRGTDEFTASGGLGRSHFWVADACIAARQATWSSTTSTQQPRYWVSGTLSRNGASPGSWWNLPSVSCCASHVTPRKRAGHHMGLRPGISMGNVGAILAKRRSLTLAVSDTFLILARCQSMGQGRGICGSVVATTANEQTPSTSESCGLGDYAHVPVQVPNLVAVTDDAGSNPVVGAVAGAGWRGGRL